GADSDGDRAPSYTPALLPHAGPLTPLRGPFHQARLAAPGRHAAVSHRARRALRGRARAGRRTRPVILPIPRDPFLSDCGTASPSAAPPAGARTQHACCARIPSPCPAGGWSAVTESTT